VAARGLGARLRRLRGGELAQVLRDVARARLRGAGGQAARHLDRALPVLLLLVDLEQARLRLRGRGGLLQAAEHLLRAVEDARLQVVLAERGERGELLLGREVGALEQVLVHADRAVVLAAAPEQAAEREMQLDRLGIDLHHLDERLDRLVGLLVHEEVQALEVRLRQRARLAHQVADVDARGEPAQAEEQREAEQPPVFELHG
jgi:hypothetical protein